MNFISKEDLKNNLKLIRKRYSAHKSVVIVGKIAIGGYNSTIIAGPCRVESMSQMKKVAVFLTEQKIKFLRCGIYKPCTFPYASTGMGSKAFKILQTMREKYGFKIVTEIMTKEQLRESSDYIDVIQVGARNMQNYNLLEEFGKVDKPILLKRNPGASLRDFLGSAEWIMSFGNKKVILCERGVTIPYTHDKDARWSLDITIIPAVKKYSHLPIIIDPSHSAGIREFVPALSRASIAAGADGLIIEVHPNPESSVSDGLQTITFETFKTLMSEVKK